MITYKRSQGLIDVAILFATEVRYENSLVNHI